jgi:hypothetical protein
MRNQSHNGNYGSSGSNRGNPGGRSQHRGYDTHNVNWRTQDRDDDGRFASGQGRDSSARYQERDEDGRFTSENNRYDYDSSGRGLHGRRTNQSEFEAGGSPKSSYGNDEIGGTSFGSRFYGSDERPDEIGSRHTHDDDYHHWRQDQIKQFDNEYDDYRTERRKKFSDDFSKWRDERKSASNAADPGKQSTAESNKK